METETARHQQASGRVRHWPLIGHLRAYGGYYFLAVTLLVFFLFRSFPVLGEYLYARAFFPALRAFVDNSIGLIPYAVLLLVMLASILAFVFLRGKRWQVLCALFASFFWLFGFNYATLPLLQPPNIQHTDAAAIAAFGYHVVDSLEHYAHQTQVPSLEQPTLHNDSLASSMSAVLAQHGRHVWGKPRVQLIAAHSGWLSRCGIAGIYFPFAMCGFCDATFTPPVRNFVLAHEMAHACSVAPEHEADYFGFMALCSYRGEHTEEAAAKYAAYFQLYRSTRRALLAADSLMAAELENKLSENIRRDLALARAHAAQYPEFISGAQDQANQAYLTTLGQHGGIEQYHWLVYTVMQEWAWLDQ